MELSRSVIQPVQAAAREHPKAVLRAGHDFPDLVVVEAVAVEVVVAIDCKSVAVETVQAVVSAEPQVSGAVLADGSDAVLRESVLGVECREKEWLLRGLTFSGEYR